MKVAVIGTRHFHDSEFIYNSLDKVLNQIGPFTVVSGGATGPDTIGVTWAYLRDLPEPVEIPAEWNKFGRSAGMKRNRLVIDQVDLVVAFHDGKSPGTAGAVGYARQKSLPVILFEVTYVGKGQEVG